MAFPPRIASHIGAVALLAPKTQSNSSIRRRNSRKFYPSLVVQRECQ